MKIIRHGVFETNSSSTHNLTILSKNQFEKWQNGDIYKENYGERFYTKDEFNKLVEEIASDNNVEIDKVLNNTNKYDLPQTYEEYCDDDYLEVDVNSHKTPSGDEIVIICKYGRDG